jgi:hypothetical protein
VKRRVLRYRVLNKNVLAVFAFAFLSVACSTKLDSPRLADGGSLPDAAVSTCSVAGPAIVCVGTRELRCNPDGSQASSEECRDSGLTCASALGCVTCIPNARSCEGENVRVCRADGTGYDVVETCDASIGDMCTGGDCTGLCEQAELKSASLGCEYFAVPVANHTIDLAFEFAVILSNPNAIDADVTITRGGTTVISATVPAGELETIKLPWVTELLDPTGTRGASTGPGFTIRPTFPSELVADAAYRIVTSVPVTAYQFNALDFRVERACVDPTQTNPDGSCFSYTNDASLLLASHALTGSYTVLTTPTTRSEGYSGDSLVAGGTPGSFVIYGVEDRDVTVTLKFSAATTASRTDTVRAFARDETATVTLGRGDVVQFMAAPQDTCAEAGPWEPSAESPSRSRSCAPARSADLSGTSIRANGKVGVISADTCASVPYDVGYCDHVEETLFPEDTWGQTFVVGATQPLRAEPNVFRIVATNETTLTFSPAVTANTTLAPGEVLTFEANENFSLTTSAPVLIAQYLVGSSYGGRSLAEEDEGDPSQSFVVPLEQFREDYVVLTPPSYRRSYLNITAPMGASVRLDGMPVSGFEAVGTSGYGVAKVEVEGGTHRVTSDRKVGVLVYGFGAYTSYMYPGGLELEPINVLL